jgi:hypothetical protein
MEITLKIDLTICKGDQELKNINASGLKYILKKLQVNKGSHVENDF